MEELQSVEHKKESRVKAWHIAVVVVVVVAVAVGGFFGGRATAGGGTPTVQEAMKVLQSQAQQGNGNGFGFAGANAAARRGGAVSGSIIAADATSITVKTADGGTKIVLVSGSTTVAKTSEATQADLTVGQNVIVTGTTNSDGSVTATRVQVGVTLPAAGNGTTGAGDGSAPPAGAAPGGTGTAPGGTGTAPGAAGPANSTAPGQ